MAMHGLERVLTVTDAAEIIRSTVEELFFGLTIEGEVAAFRPSSTGHWYFTLKDEKSSIDAVIYRSFHTSNERPKDGDLVIANGDLTYYTKTGRLTFSVKSIKRKGEGDLIREIEKRKEYYRSLGYFDEDKKKAIPEELTTLGIVTSITGAALQDILTITKRRAPSLNILIFPAIVQGEKSAESIAREIRRANLFSSCSLLIVGRGGGSLEDLSSFSDPLVIEAIHNSNIPIISAVGHETDWAISDFVADKRAATPSAAAEIATEKIFMRRELLEKHILLLNNAWNEVYSFYEKLHFSLKSSLSASFLKIMAKIKSIPSIKDLSHLVYVKMNRAEADLAHTSETLNSLIKNMLKEKQIIVENKKRDIERCLNEKIRTLYFILEKRDSEIKALSPLSILERGYAFATKQDGSIIRKKEDLKKDEIFTLRVRDALIKAKTEEINEL